MYKIVFLFLLIFVSQFANSEEEINKANGVENNSEGDVRQFVTMPSQAREIMRKEMLGKLSALNEVIAYLASNNLDAAAAVAESKIGRSSKGKHRGNPMAPGKFMPPEMQNLARALHDTASEFSEVAKKGDLNSVYGALQKVTGSCVACHYSYRTR
jgi:hypothetical protein